MLLRQIFRISWRVNWRNHSATRLRKCNVRSTNRNVELGGANQPCQSPTRLSTSKNQPWKGSWWHEYGTNQRPHEPHLRHTRLRGTAAGLPNLKAVLVG